MQPWSDELQESVSGWCMSWPVQSQKHMHVFEQMHADQHGPKAQVHQSTYSSIPEQQRSPCTWIPHQELQQLQNTQTSSAMSTRTVQLPVIMLGMKSLWPGASSNVTIFFSVTKRVWAMSIVTPRLLKKHKHLGVRSKPHYRKSVPQNKQCPLSHLDSWEKATNCLAVRAWHHSRKSAPPNSLTPQEYAPERKWTVVDFGCVSMCQSPWYECVHCALRYFLPCDPLIIAEQ